MKFFVCRHCGNIIEYVRSSGVKVVCCGEEMQELLPNTTDGATEKHVPAVTIDGQKVTVQIGSIEHPMLEEHHIEWITLETKKGFQRKLLRAGEKPIAVFTLEDGDEAVAAYEYCNLHGLWKAEI